jgi:hypothetical protein
VKMSLRMALWRIPTNNLQRRKPWSSRKVVTKEKGVPVWGLEKQLNWRQVKKHYFLPYVFFLFGGDPHHKPGTQQTLNKCSFFLALVIRTEV